MEVLERDAPRYLVEDRSFPAGGCLRERPTGTRDPDQGRSLVRRSGPRLIGADDSSHTNLLRIDVPDQEVIRQINGPS